jgi:hypothetical protein
MTIQECKARGQQEVSKRSARVGEPSAPFLSLGLTRDLKDYTLYSMKKAGAFEVVDKKNAVVELYDAIQRALGIDGKGVDLPEIGPGLGPVD